jgi:hypothetical protein
MLRKSPFLGGLGLSSVRAQENQDKKSEKIGASVIEMHSEDGGTNRL